MWNQNWFFGGKNLPNKNFRVDTHVYILFYRIYSRVSQETGKLNYLFIDWRIFLEVNFPQCLKYRKEKPIFFKYVYCTYVISLTSSPREATSVATNILVCPSLKSSKACSLSHCSLQWKYYSLTHFYMYASNLFTSTMYFAIIVQLLIPVNWFLFPQNNQKLSLQMLTCLHEYTGSWSY